MPSNPESRASSITVSSFSYTKSWELEAENALKVRQTVLNRS
jgi:hypothetical protein